MQIALTVEQSFPVLSLPPEIRNNIWCFVVGTNKRIMISTKTRANLDVRTSPRKIYSSKPIKAKSFQSKLAVALACRQLYLETTPIYYTKNEFCFMPERPSPNDSDLQIRFLTQEFSAVIGKKNARMISFAMFFFVPQEWPKLGIASLPNLKHLNVIEFDPAMSSIASFPPEIRAYKLINPDVALTRNYIEWNVGEKEET
ncbi:hypothetical protein ACLMJK_005527 [Lecanora helva]